MGKARGRGGRPPFRFTVGGEDFTLLNSARAAAQARGGDVAAMLRDMLGAEQYERLPRLTRGQLAALGEQIAAHYGGGHG